MRGITLGGIIKSLFLKTLAVISGLKQNDEFFSILYSGKIDKSLLESVIKKSVKPIEIMLHAGLPEKDLNIKFCKDLEGRYWRSKARLEEYNAIMAVPSMI